MDDLLTVASAVLTQLVTRAEDLQNTDTPVVTTEGVEATTKDLDLERWLTGRTMSRSDLLAFVRAYCDNAADLWHPGYFAHQIAPPDTPGVVADLLQSVTNNIPLIYELGPAATVVDRVACRWMLDKVGWRAGSGTMANGGSLGNLTSLVAARNARFPDARERGNPGGTVVLAPLTSHYSVRKAAMVMGLGESGVRPLAVDEVGRIDVGRVAETLRAVGSAGQVPIALVATACATATGLYDDIAALAEICQRHGIWLHVDGAHGASALLSPRLRGRLAGIETASSLVWDGHKMMRTSALCTGVLFRDGDHHNGLFRQDASYLYREEMADVDAGQFSFETSKAPLGLKLFLTLAMRGEAALREYVESRFDLALTLWQLLTEDPRFEVPYQPHTNIMCFRPVGFTGDVNVLRRRIADTGRFYLSSAKIGDVPYLRAVLMSPATDVATLRELLDTVAVAASDQAQPRQPRGERTDDLIEL